MNAIVTTPDVKLFVQAVRERLVDLTEEEREELVGGLDADMSDLVAERGVDALPEPAEYARELRTAAGFEPEMGAVRRQLGFGETVNLSLDAVHGFWDRYAARYPGRPAEFLASLRPLWWVFRAWVAVQLLAYLLHGRNTRDLSALPGLRGVGWLLLLVAIVGSVQIGRGVWWPGNRLRARPAPAGLRLLLLGLNLLALVWAVVSMRVVVGPGTDDGYARGYDQGYSQGQAAAPTIDRKGIYVDGRWVSNIYPYDAQGRPLVGVQLVDQVGQPINVVTQLEYGCDSHGGQLVKVFSPWHNGRGGAFNVYPLTSRVQRPVDQVAPGSAASRTRVGTFPQPRLGPVELPGVAVSRQAGVPASVQKGRPGTPFDQTC